jgi:hypothetical protein
MCIFPILHSKASSVHGFFVCGKPTFVDGTLAVVREIPIWNGQSLPEQRFPFTLRGSGTPDTLGLSTSDAWVHS